MLVNTLTNEPYCKVLSIIQLLLLYNPNVDVKRALALHCRSLSEVVGMLSSHKENVKHVCWPFSVLKCIFHTFPSILCSPTPNELQEHLR